ncbi:MAG: CPXCG motif-containing cysteine-rich protein [Acidobacteriia bacterium]|nr:CPXCG motif-containing cysteine-rich protein [Terriglobia bacterium]
MEIAREMICPYCGQAQVLFVDISVRLQQYIEDCQVCCQPMEMSVTVEGEDEISIEARRSDE